MCHWLLCMYSLEYIIDLTLQSRVYRCIIDLTLQNANKKQGGDQDQLSLLNIGSIVVLVFMMFLVLFAVHCTWVTSSAYSSPSVVLASQNPDG